VIETFLIFHLWDHFFPPEQHWQGIHTNIFLWKKESLECANAANRLWPWCVASHSRKQFIEYLHIRKLTSDHLLLMQFFLIFYMMKYYWKAPRCPHFWSIHCTLEIVMGDPSCLSLNIVWHSEWSVVIKGDMAWGQWVEDSVFRRSGSVSEGAVCVLGEPIKADRDEVEESDLGLITPLSSTPLLTVVRM